MRTMAEIRKSGFDSLKDNWVLAVLVTILSLVIGVYTFGPVPSLTVKIDDIVKDPTLLVQINKIFTIDMASVRSLLFFILGAPGILGACHLYLSRINGKEVKLSTFFERFPLLYKAIGLRAVRTLITAVGLILFIFPGIMVHYTFSMAPWIMAEDTGVSIKEAMNRSREMMTGHKMEVFLFDLGYFPWAFVSLLTVGLGLFFFIPYHKAGKAAYYKEISEQYNNSK